MVDSLSVLSRVMDFQSAMETFAEAWVAANVTQVNICQRSSSYLFRIYLFHVVFRVKEIMVKETGKKCIHKTITKDMSIKKQKVLLQKAMLG